MKLAIIIREAGLNIEDFPRASQIPIDLRDSKWREIPGSDVSFSKPIFASNPRAQELFLRFLEKLEKNLDEEPEVSPCIDLRISPTSLFVRVSHPFFQVIFFDRQPEC